MLITNPNYSCIISYIESTKETFNKQIVKCEYKSYDKSKENFVYFICFDLKTNIKLNDDIYLKEVKYEGKLDFCFNQLTNEIYIKQIPYIMYGDIKVPVFTSDIAQIIVERLANYISKEKIKLVFSNPLIIFAEDTGVANVIPSIVDTPNHKLLTSIMKNIKIEEAKIIAETLRYKEKLAKIERKQNIAIAKKRKVLGLDPKEFVSVSEFQEKVKEKLLAIWNKKIENIDRHLKANIQNYKKMVLGNNTDFVNMLEKINPSEINIKKSKVLSKLLEYFHGESLEDRTESYQDMLDMAADFILEFDLQSPEGVLAAFKRVNENYKEDLRANNYSNYLAMCEFFLRDIDGCYKYAEYNPAFQKYYWEYQKFRERHNYDYDEVIEEIKYYKMHLLPLDLIIQIDRLKKKYEHYELLINYPDLVDLKFYRNSHVWGSIIQLPYWSRMEFDPKYDMHLLRHESFNLLMIQPGVIELDLNNIIRFCYGINSKSRIIYIGEEYFFNKVDRFMVTIPSSLPYSQIEMIINYAHDCGKFLNFVCENIDTYIIVKKILFDKSIKSYLNGEKYFENWCFVNVDPTYYESFLTNTPSNKVLWHKYDYSSDYKYRRKQLLSFDRQIELAIDYSTNGNSSIDYQMLWTLLFGDYSSESVFFTDVNDFNGSIESETNYWENELKLSRIRQKERAALKKKEKSIYWDPEFGEPW